MYKTAFCRFSRAVCAFICACAILCHRDNTRLRAVIWGTRRGGQNIALACLPSSQARAADAMSFVCMVFLLVGLLQNIRSTLEHAARRLAFIYTFARFCFSSSSSSILSFSLFLPSLPSFLPVSVCLSVCRFLFPSFLRSLPTYLLLLLISYNI